MSASTYTQTIRQTATARDDRSDIAERSVFHEVWTCRTCDRHFPDATSCCAHEAQCGDLTRC
jgi:hypothetical protein